MSPTQPAAVPTTRMTVDEYWEFVNRPENADRFFELRRGEVIEMSRPTVIHGIVCLNIGTDLNNYARKHRRGYATSNDSGVVLEEELGTVVGPDVAYYVGAKRFEDVPPKWSDRPPVLAVEVLSPNDKPGKVTRKVDDYLNGGVQVVWVVDYEERNVTVYRPDRRHSVVGAGAVLSGDPEMPGLACPVDQFFVLPEDDDTETPPAG